MAGLMEGKRGIVFGVANKRSIAWAIVQALAAEGAQIALTYQNERLVDNAKELAASLKDPIFLPCEVTEESQIKNVFSEISKKWDHLDFLVHSLAFAKAEELDGEFLKVTDEGFKTALTISAYSLAAICKEARPMLAKSPEGASVMTMTYIGAERAIKNYNVMGVAKAALEATVRYLAADLGPERIRVNAISAGPVNTLAARGIKGFSDILKHVADRSPMKRNIDVAEVGDTGLFLASRLSRGITGEVIHVDAGYHIAGV